MGQLIVVVFVPVVCAAGMLGAPGAQEPPIVRAAVIISTTMAICTLGWKR